MVYLFIYLLLSVSHSYWCFCTLFIINNCTSWFGSPFIRVYILYFPVVVVSMKTLSRADW